MKDKKEITGQLTTALSKEIETLAPRDAHNSDGLDTFASTRKVGILKQMQKYLKKKYPDETFKDDELESILLVIAINNITLMQKFAKKHAEMLSVPEGRTGI